ncbi:hypothetical protein FH972_011479 [Carpinus fangiana]|uniref:Membrane insertase YidC/Oxa/ALB C-terminal domain-containing protein n=1 Tax=Carpinus fangiana TaxID=176857 RepID=A0A660KTK3_9ROSI|nr:hypothetical protein FH972_011479 [Carpinus fangiana]
MAKTLISSPPFIGAPLPSLSRHGFRTLPQRGRLVTTRVKLSFHDIPPVHSFHSLVDFSAALTRVEGLLYTLADAAVAADPAASSADAVVQKNNGWFGFISDAMEVVLKVLKDGLETVHVPYAYGFAIILLTVIVKAATYPLTKQQVESTLAMQNLQPKIKAIQQRYAGNQERIQLETSRLYKQAGVNPLAGCFPTLATIPVWIGLYQALSNVANEGLLTEGFFWIPSLAGPTTIAARQSGTGVSWLFPFVDGHPPLGWHDTAAYLVLPVLLVASQFTNNVLSTAQQVWLRKLGGAKPVVSENASGIITAGRAKRAASQPVQSGERFRQLKEEEKKKTLSKALPAEDVETLASTSDSDDDSEEETKNKGDEVLEEAYASGVAKEVPRPRRSKRSKRKRAV